MHATFPMHSILRDKILEVLNNVEGLSYLIYIVQKHMSSKSL